VQVSRHSIYRAYEGSVYYCLKECPFNGGEHRGQGKKTAIIQGKSGMGFKCWSDDCFEYDFNDLVDLLEEEAGERYEIVDDEVLAVRWGGIELIGPSGPSVPTTIPAPSLTVLRGRQG
jgi:hypothetical protein